MCQERRQAHMERESFILRGSEATDTTRGRQADMVLVTKSATVALRKIILSTAGSTIFTQQHQHTSIRAVMMSDYLRNGALPSSQVLSPRHVHRSMSGTRYMVYNLFSYSFLSLARGF